MKKRTRKAITFTILVAFILSLLITLLFISPEELVELIGIQNVYSSLFIISFFGGFSSWTAFSMLAVLVTLATSGLNIISLGIIAGIGLAIGDVIMFIACSNGRDLVTGKLKEKIESFAKKFETKKRIIPYLTFFYMGFTPFPNDVLSMFLAVLKMRLRAILIPYVVGDIIYCTGIAYLASIGFTFF